MHVLQGRDIPSFLAIYRIHGPFLFGGTEKIDEIRRELPTLPSIVVLRLRNMTAIDSTGLQALERLALEVRGSGRTLLLCGAREQPARLMRQASFAQHVGPENICAHITAALERANAIHDQATDEVLST
jgi:SulP family sulfate permease